MSDPSFTFTHALMRAPSRSIAQGLRAVDTGDPDPALLAVHHAQYAAALRSTGAVVTVLPALDDFPDSVFVEDTALCLPQGAVLMRPGAPTRRGEVAQIEPALAALYPALARIEGPGTIEAGDILTTGREILVGRSARTDAAGIAALRAIVEPWGHRLREVAVPEGVLHFKTDCGLLDGETILATGRLAASGCLEGYRLILTAPGEEAAANVIRFNDLVIMPAGFPRTADAVRQAGHTVCEIGNTEAAKLDGGMSCLSLRFTPPAG